MAGSGARAVWVGVIAFGIATVPVKAYIAAKEREIETHMLHPHEDGTFSRVRQQWRCDSEDAVVERDATVRGYEFGGKAVVLSDEDLEKLPKGSRSTLVISSFAPRSSIAPVFVDESYSLGAEEGGRRGVALLLRLLSERELVAVGTVTMRGREQVCVLQALGGTLLLSTLFYADEVRVEPGLPMPDVALSEAELAMGGDLVSRMTGAFDLHGYSDSYRAALVAALEAKAADQPIAVSEAEPAREPLSLVDALKRSLAATKPARPRRAKTEAEPAAAPGAATPAKAGRSKKTA